MTQVCRFETPDCTRPFSFFLTSSHHHPLMNFYHISLLLLVVLSAYSEGPQHAKSPEPTVCSNSSISLGVLAPILPQYEVFKFTLPSKVYMSMSTLPQNEVFKSALPQNEVFNNFPVNCQFFCPVKTVMYSLSNIVKSFQNLTSTALCGGEKIGWSIRMILESFQHVFKMYAWSLSESRASIQLQCKLTALFSKKSFFRKHDFAIYEYKLYHSSQNVHLKIFSYNNKISTLMQTKGSHLKNHTNFISMVVERLLYFQLMNSSHTPLVTCRISSISFYGVSKRMTCKSLF